MNLNKQSSNRKALSVVIIVSVGLHLVAGVVFAYLKIVEAINRDEKTFEAPPIQEVPQQEPEYQVNIEQRNKASAPPRPNPIVVDSPDVTLPALDIDVSITNSTLYGRGTGGLGTGDGNGGGGSIREMVMNLTEFGYDGQMEGTLEGILVDLKVRADGEPSGISRGAAEEFIREFTGGSWSQKMLQRYYIATKRLYAAYWIVPKMDADVAPKAFDVADEVDPMLILAHYKGLYTPEKDARIRLLAFADDVLVVRFNGRVILDGSYDALAYTEEPIVDPEPTMFLDFQGEGAPVGTRTSDWFNIRAGQSYKMEILLGEIPGNFFGFYLLYQEEGDSKWRVFSTKTLNTKEKSFIRKLHPDAGNLL